MQRNMAMANTDMTDGAMCGDELVTEAMHAMPQVLEDWERVCAAGKMVLEERYEVDERFVCTMKQLIKVLIVVLPPDSRSPNTKFERAQAWINRKRVWARRSRMSRQKVSRALERRE
jgi:hypothetical protein